MQKTGKRGTLVLSLKTDSILSTQEHASSLFPFAFPFLSETFLPAICDGLTAFLAFPATHRSGHFSTAVQEMPASFTSPSLKSGMTHVWHNTSASSSCKEAATLLTKDRSARFRAKNFHLCSLPHQTKVLDTPHLHSEMGKTYQLLNDRRNDEQRVVNLPLLVTFEALPHFPYSTRVSW